MEGSGMRLGMGLHIVHMSGNSTRNVRVTEEHVKRQSRKNVKLIVSIIYHNGTDTYRALTLFIIKIKKCSDSQVQTQWQPFSPARAAIAMTCTVYCSTRYSMDIFTTRHFLNILHLQYFTTNSFVITEDNSIVFCYSLQCFAFDL